MKQRTSRSLTITEIAARAGVSVPTVSRVLNNRPDVAPGTRERVERIIQESGFVHTRGSNAFHRGRRSIDIVVPGLDTMCSVEIVRGVSEVVERSGLRLALSTTNTVVRREQQWQGKVLEDPTDGAILVLPPGLSSHLDELHRLKIPFVVVDHRGELGTDIPSVSATNWSGGRTATAYLLSLGHRRIAVIGGGTTLRCSIDRVAGYRSALEEAGVPIRPEYIRQGEFLQQTGYEQTCALLELPEPPTAIFAGSDVQAMGVYSALRARGVAIPEMISVVGFDDIPLASLTTPALTSVRQPLVEMGRVATAMLLHLIAQEPLESMRIELATTLIVRESCTSWS